MKAQELRIGNWLVYKQWHKNGTDRNFMVRDLFYEGDNIGLTDGMIQTGVSFDSVKPIPLTEEWLKKGDFEKLKAKMSNCIVYQKDLWRIAFHLEDKEYHLWHERVSPPTWKLATIKHVHQLQNLYFALTGKELTL